MEKRQRTAQDRNSTSTAFRENGRSNPKERSLHPESTLSGLLVDRGGMFGAMAIATNNSPPINRLRDSYLLALQASRRRPGTLEMHRRVLDRFTAFVAAGLQFEPGLGDLNPDNARAYLIWLQDQPKYRDHPNRKPTGRISPSTVNQHARCLRAFANWLFMEEYTAEHALRRLRLPKAPKVEMKPLSPSEVQHILRSLNQATVNGKRTAAIVSFLYDTGMRAGELVGLRLADVDFQTGEIQVMGKGEKGRTVVAGRLALRALRRYVDARPEGLGRASDRIFLNSTGRPTTVGDIDHVFRRLRPTCGISRLHPHLLRHSFAVQFLRNGGDVLTLQRLLGHASVATTNRYVTLASVDLVNSHRKSSPLDNM